METELATALVTLLVQHDATPGNAIQAAMLDSWYAEAGWDAGEIEPALINAGELGWIEEGSEPETLRLTAEGYVAGGGQSI